MTGGLAVMSSPKGCQFDVWTGQTRILEPTVFVVSLTIELLLVLDVPSNLGLFKPDCGYRLPSCPEFLSVEIPFSPSVVACHLNRALALHVSNYLRD